MIRLAVLLKVTCCYNSDILVGRIMVWLEECSSVVTRLCYLRLQLLLRLCFVNDSSSGYIYDRMREISIRCMGC